MFLVKSQQQIFFKKKLLLLLVKYTPKEINLARVIYICALAHCARFVPLRNFSYLKSNGTGYYKENFLLY